MFKRRVCRKKVHTLQSVGVSQGLWVWPFRRSAAFIMDGGLSVENLHQQERGHLPHASFELPEFLWPFLSLCSGLCVLITCCVQASAHWIGSILSERTKVYIFVFPAPWEGPILEIRGMHILD